MLMRVRDEGIGSVRNGGWNSKASQDGEIIN